jgi:hypothetical protein
MAKGICGDSGVFLGFWGRTGGTPVPQDLEVLSIAYVENLPTAGDS